VKSLKIKKGNQRRGTAAVEFAMVMPVFVLVLIGTIELCNLNIKKAVVINGAREAVRLAINANAVENTIVSNAKSQMAPLLKTSTGNITCTLTAVAPDGSNRASFSQGVKGDLIRCMVSVPYSKVSTFAGGLGNTSILVTETCTMQKE
jgi:Flp pilus assembly protein TadG